MPCSPRRLAAVLTLLVLALAAPVASASSTQESTFQDDPRIVYHRDQAALEQDLVELKQLGVDRIRVSVFWHIIAPEPRSNTRPQFDATNPAAYPAQHWERYDRIVRTARRLGLAVNLNVTSPAPWWATPSPPRESLEESWDPSAVEFERFVTAVGLRYSGSYRPQGQAQPLPRVDFWSIWNEPNVRAWLTPTWRPGTRRGTWVEAGPSLYRNLLQGAVRGLVATGHAGDTIILGETSSSGDDTRRARRESAVMTPGRFIRNLYCLDARYRILRGSAARARGCPATVDREAFVRANPALFRAAGWGHHPYALFRRPNQRTPRTAPSNRDWATLAEIRRLTSWLDRAQNAYRARPDGGFGVYITEYGYQTNPPDPFIPFSPRQQAAFLNQSEYLTYRQRRVRSHSQFLLVDDAPDRNRPDGGWYTFQSGLRFENGRKKPAWAAYRFPLFVVRNRVRRGRKHQLFGLLRTAPAPDGQRVQVEYLPRRSRTWRVATTITATGERGYLNRKVRFRRSGEIRLRWEDPATGRVIRSRTVGIVVGR